MQILYQNNPRDHCTYIEHKDRTFTNSRESYQNGACKETLILRRNGRTPTQELVLHFLTVFSAVEINELRTKIFRVLTDNGLVAVANLELTRGKDGKPNNCVHSHILTDDQRSGGELQQLLETACERQGLVKGQDFQVDHRLLWDGYRYFNYFTKFGKKYFNKVILFEKGLLESGRTLQKFYTIGAWFKKGRGKGKIWDEIKAECQKKHRVDIDDSNNSKDNDLADIDNELPNESIPEEYSVAALCDYLIDDYMCEWSLNALNSGGATRRTRRTRLNPDDIPTGTSIDFVRYFMRERYGVDIDEVTGGNEAITRLFILSVGKFRKYPESGWYCIDEFRLPDKPTQRAQTPDEAIRANMTSTWDKGSTGQYRSPQKRIRDRRYEWQRFKYSVAFLN